MPLDLARIVETRGWLVKAAEDLRAADFERTAQPPLTSDIVFHAQQAAEKVMKGFLTWHDCSGRFIGKLNSRFESATRDVPWRGAVAAICSHTPPCDEAHRSIA